MGELRLCSMRVRREEDFYLETSFIVPGNPMGKQRPKFTHKGKISIAYTPEKTRKYEEKVKIEYNKVNRGTFFEGPLSIDIHGVFSIPKSVSKKKHQELIGQPHDKKPDSDNMGKIILDPLNKLAFNDDGQVSKLNIDKVYGENPRVEVRIREMQSIVEKEIRPAIVFLTQYPMPAIYSLTDTYLGGKQQWNS